MKTFTFELMSGYDIEFVIGQNARENTQIVQDSSSEDIWFHAGDGISSCHVIAQIPDDDSIQMTKRDRLMIVKKGAVLCKENTNKLKSQHHVPFIYTTVKNISTTKTMGEVKTKCSVKTISI
jgi:predicted ribosome quality control (RQC) complex YloA/Tae2 family protein